jgi:aspartate/methionine/tyrosine aminotransferase
VAASTLYEASNQYPSLLGTPELRQAIAAHSAEYQQLPLDWTSEVVVTAGAQEGIAAALMGLCNPGDEVRAAAAAAVAVAVAVAAATPPAQVHVVDTSGMVPLHQLRYPTC